ncbi:DUF3885 domain-containing protein [Hymenobacter sp. P5252]|uniref:DUF3885 domain-containing protein n=1 Tax=Hymenobacter terrestris TaxID=2748310 RepID=A0ABX2Q3U0_9BACT|nr:DUF3885 domain-containing protein [Hymenobacter terrestris]NVO85106.1 DUF3885 domain-containing protein [Hymenobacter terrestris]
MKVSKQEAEFQRLANRTRFADTRQLVRFTVQRLAAHIPHQQILQAISHQDFPGRSPQLQDDIFFLNLRSKLILQMYDDRGLDLIGPDVETIQPLYQNYNDWILDYDRAAIDTLFATEPLLKPNQD